MMIQKIGETKTIMSNPGSLHHYFAWPTVARLQNGKIAVVASGYRLAHICPFGKSVISYSEDNGETYTIPAPVIDTVLDDRDSGITTFGESGVVFTSFNNTTDFQRAHSFNPGSRDPQNPALRTYAFSYLDLVTPEAQNAVLGATYRISNDCGVTFGPLMISPVTSPHGPCALQDGNLLWVGTTFRKEPGSNLAAIQVYRMDPAGNMTRLGEIADIKLNGDTLASYEPHAIQLSDGRILCHIRVEGRSGSRSFFSTFQSESADGGKTWTEPRQILTDRGGAPAHLLQLKNGTILSVYGYRTAPYGIRAMVSTDMGQTWQTDMVLCDGYPTDDLGYPATAELDDGTLLTVFYARTELGGSSLILQQKWKLV